MRHFYKLPINFQNAPLMVHIMQNQKTVFDAEGMCGPGNVPVDAKKIALGIMQITNGTALTSCELRRIDHDHKFPIPPAMGSRYIVVLHGQIMCLVDDECPAMNAGESWWVDPKADAVILNKSGDDAVLLGITMMVD